MPTERKVRLPMPDGKTVDGIEISIARSSEPWSELTLSDGTLMRIKSIVSSVVRVDGQYDQEGNPVYVVKATPAISLVDVPERLRRKG
jgi:hypothetical protein